MDRTKRHRRTHCTARDRTGRDRAGRPCRGGHEPIERLHAAVAAAGVAVGDEIEVPGRTAVERCGPRCLPAPVARSNQSVPPGGVDPDASNAALPAVGRASDAADRRGGRPGKTWHRSESRREPAAILDLGPETGWLS